MKDMIKKWKKEEEEKWTQQSQSRGVLLLNKAEKRTKTKNVMGLVGFWKQREMFGKLTTKHGQQIQTSITQHPQVLSPW